MQIQGRRLLCIFYVYKPLFQAVLSVPPAQQYGYPNEKDISRSPLELTIACSRHSDSRAQAKN